MHWTKPWSFGIRSPALGGVTASRISCSGAPPDTQGRADNATTSSKSTPNDNWLRGGSAVLSAAAGPPTGTSFLPAARDVSTRQPQPAHTLTTSPELLRRRHEQLAAAQDLTRQLSRVASVAEARDLFTAHAGRFNGIHWSALLTRLARLDAWAPASGTLRATQLTTAAVEAHSCSRGRGSSSSGSALPSRPLAPAQRSELRAFVGQQLLPRLGLSLMGLAPRHLAAVLAALADLALPPPAFWMDEWLQHFGRRLEAAAAASGVDPAPAAVATGLSVSLDVAACSNGAHEGAGAGAGGEREGREGLAASRPRSALQPKRPNSCDIAQAMWALARLRGMRADNSASGSSSVSGLGMEPVHTSNETMAATRALGPVPSNGAGSSSGCKGGGGSGGGPSLVWLNSAAAAFAAAAPAAAPRELSGYLAAAARLGYRPPAAAMAAVLARCAFLMHVELGSEAEAEAGTRAAAVCSTAGPGSARAQPGAEPGAFGPRELSGVLWALAALGFNPGATWLGLADRLLLRLSGGEEAEPPPPPQQQQQEQGVQVTSTEDGAGAAVSCTSGQVAASMMPQASPPAAGLSGDWWGDHFAVAASPANATPKALQPLQPRGRAGQPPPRALALLDARQAATCAWALAKLGHMPPPGVMRALLRHTCGGVGDVSSSVSTSVLACSTNRVSGSGSSSSSSSNSSNSSCGMKLASPRSHLALRAARAQDLSMLAFALGVMRYRPEAAQQAAALLAAMASRMGSASDQDLVVWAAALSRLRLAVPAAWAAALVRHSAPRLHSLPPLALVNWVAAMAELQTAAAVASAAAPAAAAASTADLHHGPQGLRRWRRLTKAKKERLYWEAKAAAARAKQQQQQLEQQRSRHRSDHSGPWVVVALPAPGAPPGAAGSCRTDPAPAAAELSTPSGPTAAPASTNASDSSAAGAARVVVRPAAALLRPALLARLARLASARLPDLDLEATCRLAWAAARLRVRPAARGVGLAGAGGWVDTLVAASMEKLERRLRQAHTYEQAQAAAQANAAEAQEQGRRRSGLEGEAEAGALVEDEIVSPAAPVVGAEWLLKLVWAVSALLRLHRAGLRRLALRKPLLARLWQQRQQLRLQLRRANTHVDRATLAALRSPARTHGARHPQARRWQKRQKAAEPASAAVAARPPALLRRRWCTLLMAALWPQLAALSNMQLLRLVNGLAALYESGGPGKSDGSSSSGAGRSSSRGRGSSFGAAEHGAALGRSAGVARPRPPRVVLLPRRQRGMAAALHAYCRQRVEATCGGEDACDVTTAGLLRTTSAWQAAGAAETAVKHKQQQV
ncbi:hypothetical protein HYH02_007859 [Chlamydomonas schloesseri]|uniref:Uncharacterized protein n=1 Tax=Chlamydomonas schloesseri TaxID=2026947 RepID=A0A836B431_9CHLO|nr:hypothetical protein HYH02_007859 [Chlamydomonas schloesseri]|eukprot:KAG2447111.1 hypothetical protein HYH02_007859 [Chlamydomonas schloesseri]